MNKYTNAYKKQGLIFKKRPSYINMPNRRIITNVRDQQVCDNSIKTSKYTPLNFVPLNLIVQFSKVANIYFLIIGIMQMIDSISVSGGFPVIFIPLGIVVGVSGIKDFYQDLKRKKSDQQVNNQMAQVLTKDGWKQIQWKFIKIGDVIKVKQNQQVAADIILLQSSDQKNSCFIQTKNLDGETNLKFKRVKQQVYQDFGKMEDCFDFYQTHKEFNYQKPNPYIYTFTGSYNKTPIDNNNVILRGCMLKITNWVTGVVVYTGYDSKIMLNSNKSRAKKSRLQFKMGLIVASIFFTQMLVTGISALISAASKNHQIFSFQTFYNAGSHFFVKWGSWVLLFTNFVPISLIVSLEMVKYIQGINITNSKFKSTKPSQVIVQTSSLNEELGQIQHLFSDKTGTLTCNYMSFKYLVVGDQVYGYGHNKSNIPQYITNVDFHDQQFINKVKKQGQQYFQADENKLKQFQLFHMLIALTLCHNVIIQQNEKGQKKYNASSPDQLAFINMAKYCGYQYQGINSQNQLCYTNKDRVYKYKLLHLIQFDSDRKRMSVIVQKQGRVFLYCKGADNIIIQRLKDDKNLKRTQDHLHSWSVSGLRTLLFAMRQIRLDAYEKWAKMYAYSLSRLQQTQKISKLKIQKAITIQQQKQVRQSKMEQKAQFNIGNISKFILDYNISQTSQKKQSAQQILNEMINGMSMLNQYQKRFLELHLQNFDSSTDYTSQQLQGMLQKELILIGATAIQDRLQDNVKQTISSISQAGVKVWMLTGDKRQTAINIGISCGLVTQDMAIIKWEKSVQNTLQQRQKLPQDRLTCIVVTGQDLIDVQPSDQSKLLTLLNSCDSIICCRVTPKQKQDMVWLMRKNKFTTLSIGDGANDVNMINTAHVGVGIKGVQGAQAALCSDYAITQFQLLGQLMLYHGRQSYRKNSQLILFNFYKNLILVLPLLWYGVSNQFSATNIYDPWVYQLYNVIFTSVPIVLFAIFDQQYTVQFSLQNPKQYHLGLYNTLFNVPHIIKWFVSPVIYSFFLCFFTFTIMNYNISSQGYFYSIISAGMSIFAQCVLLCNLKILLLSYKYSYALLISIILGFLSFYGSCYLANWWFGTKGDLTNIMQWQVGSATYWVAVTSGVGFIMILQLGIIRWKFLQKNQKLNYEKKMRQSFNQIQMPILHNSKNKNNEIQFQ